MDHIDRDADGDSSVFNTTENLDKLRGRIKQDTLIFKPITTSRGLRAPVLAILLIFLFSGAIMSTMLFSDNNSIDNSSSESDFPNVSLTDLNGNSFSLNTYKSKLLLLDWTASWCSTCKQQYPILRDIHNSFPEVVIITISMDPDYDTSERLVSFRDQYEITWQIARDTDQASREFEITTLGTLVLIDRAFSIVHQSIGVTSYETLESWIISAT